MDETLDKTESRTDSPLARAVERVGDRWTLLIVEELLPGPRRFNEILQDIGAAPNILAARLKRLEREGIVHARPYSRRPVRVAYDLTASGRELAGAMRLLAQWGARATDAGSTLQHDACGTPMEARWYCPTCARMVDADSEEDLRYV